MRQPCTHSPGGTSRHSGAGQPATPTRVMSARRTGLAPLSARAAFDESEPPHEAPLAVGQHVADLADRAVRQQHVGMVSPAVEHEFGHAPNCT